MLRRVFVALLLLASPAANAADGWRDMLRDYLRLKSENRDCRTWFPGFDPEMARLGDAFARAAYPGHIETGRRNFRRLALRLNLSNPDDGERVKLLVPNKVPWPGYAGPVDSDGLVHFVFNTGTLPMPILSHPIVRLVLKSDVSHSRVRPAAAIAARVIRSEGADISVVEHDAATRAALIAKIRKAFDAEHPSDRMTDAEAGLLERCLPYMV